MLILLSISFRELHLHPDSPARSMSLAHGTCWQMFDYSAGVGLGPRDYMLGFMPHARDAALSDRNSVKGGSTVVRQEERMEQMGRWCFLKEVESKIVQ